MTNTAEHEMILNELKEVLERHDWYFDMSDDYSVYSAGRASASRITALRQAAARAGCAEQATVVYNSIRDKLTR